MGKTSTARILAKALNCSRGPTVEPCGECDSCQEIAASNSLDVQEIDAASNTGVDNIRELREGVRYGTARDRFKIYIIDEVHMLSNAAFNALLKTLEEPPAHVKFILATTEHQKLPVTITSRCQEFNFKPIPFSVIMDRLHLICREEGLEISDNALRTIVSTAQGSMRDAQSTLDQITAFSGNAVADEDVLTLLGVIDEQSVRVLLDAIVSRDKRALLERTQELVNRGVDPHHFCKKLVGHIRNLLVFKAAGWDDRLLQLPDTDRDALLKQAERFSELDLIRFYDLLNRTENEMRWNPHPHVHLEMTLLKMIELAQLPSLEEVIGQIQGSQPLNLKPQAPGPKPQASSSPDPQASGFKPQVLPGDQVIRDLLRMLQMEEETPLYSALEHAKLHFEEGKLTIAFGDGETSLFRIVRAKVDQIAGLCSKVTGATPEVEVKLDEKLSRTQTDPTQDPQVKMFLEAIPSKIMDQKLED